ncbi:hypothetical protein TNCV_977001 [Trichonephila clavipes]|nr:hypothetical protein TNCV_977001 [Trichonephila clavipes]
MSRREKSFKRKFRHHLKSPPTYGHFKIIKKFKAINKIEAGHTQQLETQPGCGETQEESIRTGPESVVANGAALARERKTKLTPPGKTTMT